MAGKYAWPRTRHDLKYFDALVRGHVRTLWQNCPNVIDEGKTKMPYPEKGQAGKNKGTENRPDLEKDGDRKHESKVRAWNVVTGIFIGLVIAGLAKLLFG